MDTVIFLLITMAFSAFFSGMEIAFVSVDKLRFEMEREVRRHFQYHFLFPSQPEQLYLDHARGQ